MGNIRRKKGNAKKELNGKSKKEKRYRMTHLYNGIKSRLDTEKKGSMNLKTSQ